jgi:17beta-estradiol 17-dehydrogenase / very-long-chain 3-oxoacyl-CoA reductase
MLCYRRKGFVINVSSGSGNQPTPLLAMYASTKAFVNEFSQCLHYEMNDFGVEVMGVTPYYVTSNMYKKKPGILNCSAERMVNDSLVVLGHYDICYPYVFHAILGNMMKLYWKTPQALMRSMKKTRARAASKKDSKPRNGSR